MFILYIIKNFVSIDCLVAIVSTHCRIEDLVYPCDEPERFFCFVDLESESLVSKLP